SGTWLVPLTPCQIPVDNVPAPGPQPQLNRSCVDDHLIARTDRPGQLRERVRVLGPRAEIHFNALQPGTLVEYGLHFSNPKRRHVPLYNEAMSRSTRSSRDLNGSLHKTVRCAWSFSLRCTQSTV